MTMKTITLNPGVNKDVFPYTLADLVGWVIRRTDGTVVKYELSSAKPIGHGGYSAQAGYQGKGLTSLAKLCAHDPVGEPIFATESLALYIADAAGVRKFGNDFDVVIDCGGAMTQGKVKSVLSGDPELCEALDDHAYVSPVARVFKIDWPDRAAPPVNLDFWAALADNLEGDVVINCQGGHGRSGTALTALMMVLNPSYGSREAILHLRAMHCTRAIESKAQHEYLDKLAAHLGRKGDSASLLGIKSYKESFLALKGKGLKVYHDRLKGAKKGGA